jgi:hypothetical protein
LLLILASGPQNATDNTNFSPKINLLYLFLAILDSKISQVQILPPIQKAGLPPSINISKNTKGPARIARALEVQL